MGIPVSAAPLAYVLLLLITAASLYALRDHEFLKGGLFEIRAVRQRQEWYRLITPAFLHGDGGHLLVNMLTFFFFGPAVEVMYGTGGLAILFFGSQLGAQLFTLWRKRTEPDYKSLGASGAVSGIVLAFCVVRPFDMLYLLFAIPIPAILFAVFYIAYSTWAMAGTRGRIAHEAHLGGALAGIVLAFLLPLQPGMG
jgi:membrane associated rhomboid family serine protease